MNLFSTWTTSTPLLSGAWLEGARRLGRRLKRATTLFVQPRGEERGWLYSNAEIAALYDATRPDPALCIDDQTWNDLALWRYCETIGEGSSLPGQQALYAGLRGSASEKRCQLLRARLEELAADPAQSARLQAALAPLRRNEFDISPMLFGALPSIPAALSRWIAPYQLALLLAFCLPLFDLAFLVPALALSLVGFGVQVFWMNRLDRFEAKLEALVRVLDSAIAVAECGSQASRVSAHIVAEAAALKRLRSTLARSAWDTAVPMSKLYSDWFFLNGLRHFARSLSVLAREREALQRLYIALAELDAQLALERHLRGQARLCWAERDSGAMLRLEHVVNPLLVEPIPVSYSSAAGSTLLSGKNGAGKSTFLRTLGLAVVTGRAFGFCYASAARVPVGPFYTSIQVEDSGGHGDSLYMAELRRARQMLDAGELPGSVCIIDEIFHGTNHLESVASAVAVLGKLVQRSLVIVSTHNLILAPLLRGALAPLVLQAEGGKLEMVPGVLADTNGIALLSRQGFDASIVDVAGQVAAWLTPYLAHPDHVPVWHSGAPKAGSM